MRKLSLIFALLPLSLSAQTIFLQPHTTTLTVPAGTTKTLTARVEGVNNKGVTWTTTGGTLVGNTTCTATPCTIGLYSATAAGPFTVTATSAVGAVTATQAITFGASPTPIACSSGAPDTSVCHPRFLLTPSQVAAFQAKAVSGNPMYVGYTNVGLCQFNGTGCGGGNANATWNWSCGGGPGNTHTGLPTSDQTGAFPEFTALIFARLALADPSDPTYNWKCYARDMWVYAENAVIDGKITFRGGNEFSQAVEAWALTEDLLEATGYLNSTDIQTYLEYARFSTQDLLLNNPYDEGSPPWNNLNTVTQLTSLPIQRGMAGNYEQSKLLLITGASLTADNNTVDDPTIPQNAAIAIYITNPGTGYANGNTFNIAACGATGTVTQALSGVPAVIVLTGMGSSCTAGVQSTTATSGSGTGLTVTVILGNTCNAARGAICSDFTGGSLHAYWTYFTGSFLEKWYAHAEDPAVALSALNTAFPTGGFTSPPICSWDIAGTYTCMGDGVGGESSEGTGYWWHVYTTVESMAAWTSAGYGDPLLYGPQMSLAYSSFWDQEMMSQQANWAFFGANGQPTSPGYTAITTGDTELGGYVTNPSYQLWATYMMVLDGENGRSDRNSSLEWSWLNSAFGGPKGTSGGCTSQCGIIAELSNDFGSTTAFGMMIVLPGSDPTVSLPSDPRPSYPTDLWNNSYNQHQQVRSGWTPSDAVVNVYGNNTQLDHEHNIQGGFDVIQNSEYLTKGRTEFDNYNNAMSMAPFRNMTSILNTLPATNYNHCYQNQIGQSIVLGGQFGNANQTGLNFALHSEMPAYTAFHIDDTQAYNGCDVGGAWDYTDVTGASREFLWIRGSNQIIVYDRAATGASANKSDWMISTGAVTVTGNAASWPTRSATQKANFTTLLPSGVNPTAQKLIVYVQITAPFSTLQSGNTMQAVCTAFYADGTNANVTADPNTDWYSDGAAIGVSSSGLISTVGSVSSGADAYCTNNGVASFGEGFASFGFVTVGSASSGTLTGTEDQTQLLDPEPMQQIRVNAGNTTATQFLNTFEWGASSFTPSTPVLAQSTAGQGYDCAKIGTSIGCFMRALTAFTGTTYAASGATTHYVYNTVPNTSYTLTGAGTPGSATSDNAGVLTFAATGTGNVTVGAGAPPTSPPFGLSGTITLSGNVQLP